MTGNLVIIALVSAVVLAATGARIAGGAPWKGGVLALAFIVASTGASMVAPSLLLAILAGAIGAAVLAGAMRIPSRQSANAILGCVLGFLVPLLFM